MRNLFYRKRYDAGATLLAEIAGAVTTAFLVVIMVLLVIALPIITRAAVDSAPAAVNPTQAVEHYPLGLPHAVELEDHRLELLMSYTIFHIGLYMSLIAAVIAAYEIKKPVFPLLAVKQAMFCFLVAGACGGIIAINVAEYDIRIHPVSHFYRDYPLTVLWWSGGCFLNYPFLEHLEHIAFWVGTLRLFVAFMLR
jgi:hypothetical protein